MIQIQDMFQNGKPDIVLKTGKGFNIKRTPFLILTSENSFTLGIVVLVMLNKMLVIVFINDYKTTILKSQSFNFCPFLTLSVRNGPIKC